MLRVAEFKDYLKSLFPSVKIYNGTIDKNSKECVGIYRRGRANNAIAIGGVENTSYSILPVSILVHWTEDADICESMANDIYLALQEKTDVLINNRRIIMFQMLDSGPVDLNRDDKNIVEMVIRTNIIYEREVRQDEEIGD